MRRDATRYLLAAQPTRAVIHQITIAMCYQTSDVSVISPAMCRSTLVHSIISFFFVLVGLGLMVNIIANFI